MLKRLAILLHGLALTATCAATDDHVWIFAGLPGDAEHHAEFEKTLGAMKQSFIHRFGIKPENLAIYYGPKSAGYAGEATRRNILDAVKTISQTGEKSPKPSHWLIFLGHAHGIRGGAQLNLPGPDLNSMDLGLALESCDPDSPLTLIFTHTASAAFLRPLAAPGRVVMTATAPTGIENETEFPTALVETLGSVDSDANKDGHLDATEIFLATHEGVLRLYGKEDLIVREAALLDGDGDGRGTQRPAEADRRGASRHFLTLTSRARGLE